MTVVVNGSNPGVYLTNGTRMALGLEGASCAEQSKVQTAQEAFYAAHGQWHYVQGMPNEVPSAPAPEKKTKVVVTSE